MKGKFALALVVLLVVSTLAGCGLHLSRPFSRLPCQPSSHPQGGGWS